MSWTYSGDPSSSARDAVRFMIGDTDADRPLLSDKEIDFTLSTNLSAREAAIGCCEAIAMKFADKVDRRIGKTMVSGSQVYEQYVKMAARLKCKSSASGVPYSGGMFEVDTNTDRNNSALKQPYFRKGMFTS